MVTAREQGWSRLDDRTLLHAAEQQGFDVLLTTDQNLRHQRNVSGLSLAVVVLSTTSWPRIRTLAGAITQALGASAPGKIHDVEVG